MKIDHEEFNRKAQHIIDTVVKPQVEKYERVKEIEEAAANLADPNLCKTENWIAGAKWQAERMYAYDEIRTIAYSAYCLGQLDEPTEGKYNLWIQQFKKK